MMTNQEADACSCEQCTAPEPDGTAVIAAHPVAAKLARLAPDDTSLDVGLYLVQHVPVADAGADAR